MWTIHGRALWKIIHFLSVLVIGVPYNSMVSCVKHAEVFGLYSLELCNLFSKDLEKYTYLHI